MASVRADGNPLPRPHLDRMQLGLDPLLPALRDRRRMALPRRSHRRALARAARRARSAVGNRRSLRRCRTPCGERRRADGSPRRDFGTSPRDLFERLDAHGVPCEIADPDFAAGVFDDPEMRARGLVVDAAAPDARTVRALRYHHRLLGHAREDLGAAAARRSAHTRDHARVRLRRRPRSTSSSRSRRSSKHGELKAPHAVDHVSRRPPVTTCSRSTP